MGMKIHTVIVDFAMQYGIKEALILSELCRRAFKSGKMVIPFPVSMGTSCFPYMSTKQVRLSLTNLIGKGAILPVTLTEQTIDRSCHYEIADTTYHLFLKTITTQQFLLLEGFNTPIREQ